MSLTGHRRAGGRVGGGAGPVDGDDSGVGESVSVGNVLSELVGSLSFFK